MRTQEATYCSSEKVSSITINPFKATVAPGRINVHQDKATCSQNLLVCWLQNFPPVPLSWVEGEIHTNATIYKMKDPSELL